MVRKKAVIALGMFDGVHIGHSALLNAAKELAEEINAYSVVYTFSNHPRGIYSNAPKSLMTAEDKKRRIQMTHTDDVVMEVFTEKFAMLSPEEYIDNILNDFNVQTFIVGYNYTFGKGGLGTADTLRAIGKSRGFTVLVIEPVLFMGEPVSSTRIRECIERGDIALANKMLGYEYTLSGKVVSNKKLGGELGFPTANIIPDMEKALPKNGVYITKAVIDEQHLRAITNVGNSPTVGGAHTTIETHVLDFSGDLYGKTISVCFLKRVRDEHEFINKAALREQVQHDKQAASDWFKNKSDVQFGK